MVLLKFGSLLTSGSGSLAGHTIQNSKGGVQLRRKPMPRGLPSPAQIAIRNEIKFLQAFWQSLSDLQRFSWNHCPFIRMAGHSFFIQYNFRRYQLGLDPVPWCPSSQAIIVTPPATGLQLWLSADFGVTQDSGHLVSAWADQSGLNHNAFQADPAKQPLYVPGQLNNLPVLRFYQKSLRSGPWTLNQPYTLIMVFNRFTQNTNFTLSGAYSTGSMYIFQTSDTILTMYSGLYSPSNSDCILNTYLLGIMSFNYGSSSFQVNNGTPVMGNPGGGNPGGIDVGSYYNGLYGLNGDIAELLVYDHVLSSVDLIAVKYYLNHKYQLY